MNPGCRALILACLLAVPGLPAAAQVTVAPDLTGLRASGERIYFGQSGSSWSEVGQTFTVPTHASVLTDFTFYLTDVSVSAAPLFRMYLMEWSGDAARPVGGVLFRSALQTGLDTGAGTPLAGYYSFSTDHLWLQPGGMYLAFLSTREDPQQSGDAYNGMFTFASHYLDGGRSAYGGGSLVARYSSRDRWQPYEWDGQPVDARFSATFDATTAPEPATMALLGTGLAGLAGAARRRRRREPAA